EVAPADIDIAYRRRVRAVIDGDPGLVLLDVRCPVGIRRDRIGRARGEVDGREAGDADVEAVTVVDYIEVQIREIDVARFIDGDGRVAVGEPQIAVARYEKPEERVQRDIVLGHVPPLSGATAYLVVLKPPRAKSLTVATNVLALFGS